MRRSHLQLGTGMHLREQHSEAYPPDSLAYGSVQSLFSSFLAKPGLLSAKDRVVPITYAGFVFEFINKANVRQVLNDTQELT